MAAYQVSAVQLNGGGYYMGCHVTLQLLLAQGSLAPVQIQVPDGTWDDDHHSDDNFACKTLTMTSPLFWSNHCCMVLSSQSAYVVN